ncbi:hypothetical protein [Cryobacterium sp. Y11]|uniref:hypothetical protein n=1 Tax=Cryobacterium sp. Y11 TaxID=2045016 RepID=UPI0011B03717|nr:hypothetical protein [Cryobacterium sp. Y11]
MSRRFGTTALIGLMAILVLSGCSVPAPESAATTDPFNLVAPIEPTWTAEADLVGYPIYHDGFVASYVAAPNGALHVVVWDAATGSEVWRDIAGLGATSSGLITLAGLESGGKSFVTYLSPSSNPDDADSWSDLMIAEIGTATSTIGMDSEIWAQTIPTVCADQTAVCFSGFLKETAGGDSAGFRSEPDSGTIVVDTDVVPANARRIGANLFSTNDRSDGAIEQLGYSAGGAIVWQVPYGEVFGDGYSADGGTHWGIFASDAVIVGEGHFVDRDRTYGSEYVANATLQTVVGLNPASGEVLWRLAGAENCWGDASELELIDGLVPLCRMNAGTTTNAFGSDGTTMETTRADYDIDLLGVDPLSGEVVWTSPLGDAGLDSPTSDLSFQSLSGMRPVNISGTARLVDILRGEASDLPDGAILACNDPRDPFQAPSLETETETMSEYGAGSDLIPCTSDLIAIEGNAYSAAAVRMAGRETVENTFVIGGASGLSSYTLSD